jgi:hypothetical protein
MQLPYTTALVIFAASELLAGDAVAFLSSKPSTRQQVGTHLRQRYWPPSQPQCTGIVVVVSILGSSILAEQLYKPHPTMLLDCNELYWQ